MIRVHKPTCPRRLDSGAEVTRSDCEAFDIAGEEYENGTKSFKFRRNIYSHPSVRQLLKRVHYRKCCFCEGKSNGFAPGDIEHYRPKGAVRQDENSIVLLPGYFWLAYSWENLYWCCQICNRSNKRDFFPLRDADKRARSNIDNLTEEDPFIIDPGGADDPRDHIKFRRELAVGLTDAGRTTVRVIGLNRVDLVEERLARLDELGRLLDIVRIWERTKVPEFADLVETTRWLLEEAIAPEAEFSAMAADYISGV